MNGSAIPQIDTPVLIVGGGPIGLAVAADLGRRGVAAKLYERREDKLGPAKMLGVGVRTAEYCRQLGVVDQVRNWGFAHTNSLDAVFVTNMTGYELGRVKVNTLANRPSLPYSPERSLPCPQTWFDPILQKSARSFPQIELRYKMEIEDLRQDCDGVTVRCRDLTTGKAEDVRAAYLVGCDGVDSTVRELLGIEVRGENHLDWSMNIYLRIPNFVSLHRITQALRYIFVGPDGPWSFLTAVDGKDLFRLQLVDVAADALTSTDIDAVMRRCFGESIPYTVEDTNLWERRRTVADRFMDGRVFLAGDSAHAHPPNGGLGMNTGIQDAFDLGWKLAAVLQGWGGPALLESYDYERRPASSRNTQVSLQNYYRLTKVEPASKLDEKSIEGDLQRRRMGDRLVEENQKSFGAPGVHLGHIYSPSPIVVPDGSPKVPDDTVNFVQRSVPGARAPHAWLEPGKSTLDLFGNGFVLLAFADVATSALADAARQRGVPFAVHRINNDAATKLYEQKLVLVRPDGHVAWRGEALPADCLALIDTVRGSGPLVAARRAADHAVRRQYAATNGASKNGISSNGHAKNGNASHGDAVRVLAIVGSLRKASFNKKLLAATMGLTPAGMTIEAYERLADIPPFNQDDENDQPESVRDLRARIQAADALLIVTPEYNYGIPGVLKNAIDWMSRPAGDPTLLRKPIAIMGAAPTNFGSVRAQLALRQVFLWTNSDVLIKPEVVVFRSQDRFNADGNLHDADTVKLIEQQLAAFKKHIEASAAAKQPVPV